MEVQSVSDIAALKAVDTATYPAVFVEAPRRSGIFVWHAGDYSGAIAADTQEGVFVKADAIAASAGAWVRKDVFSDGAHGLQGSGALRPKWFGADTTGGSSAVTALNGAISVLNYWDTRGCIDLEGGIYLIDGPLTILSGTMNASVFGNGATLEITYATGDVLVFYGGSNRQLLGCTVQDIKFNSETPRTGGRTIFMLGVSDIVVQSCHFEKQYAGFEQSVFQYGVISNCSFRFTDRPVNVNGGSGTTISNCRGTHGSGTTPEPGTIGVNISDGSGVMMTNCDWVRFDFGVYARPRKNDNYDEACNFNVMTNVMMDTCNYGLYLSTAEGGDITSNTLVNCWLSSCKEHGLYASGVKGLTVTSSTLLVCHKEGANIIGATDVTFSECNFGWNNVSNTTDGSGIILTSTTYTEIRDTKFKNQAGYPGYAGVRNQKHGIVIGNGVSRLSIEGCVFNASVSTDILRISAPTNSKIKDNASSRTDLVATEAAGTVVAIPDANGDIVITHGLIGAPNNMQTTLMFVSGASAILLTPHAATATTFAVRLRLTSTGAVVTTGTRTIFWVASII